MANIIAFPVGAFPERTWTDFTWPLSLSAVVGSVDSWTLRERDLAWALEQRSLTWSLRDRSRDWSLDGGRR